MVEYKFIGNYSQEEIELVFKETKKVLSKPTRISGTTIHTKTHIIEIGFDDKELIEVYKVKKV